MFIYLAPFFSRIWSLICVFYFECKKRKHSGMNKRTVVKLEIVKSNTFWVSYFLLFFYSYASICFGWLFWILILTPEGLLEYWFKLLRVFWVQIWTPEGLLCSDLDFWGSFGVQIWAPGGPFHRYRFFSHRTLFPIILLSSIYVCYLN